VVLSYSANIGNGNNNPNFDLDDKNNNHNENFINTIHFETLKNKSGNGLLHIYTYISFLYILYNIIILYIIYNNILCSSGLSKAEHDLLTTILSHLKKLHGNEFFLF